MGSALTLAFCFLAALCEGADVQAAGSAAGGLVRDLAPTPAALGAFFSAGNLGLLVGALAGGRLADRVGRKAVIVASLVAFGGFSLLTSLAPTMPELVAARALTGVGLGGAMPNLIALVTETGAPAARNRRIALTYTGFPLGGTLASLLGALIDSGSWRWIFVCGGAAPLLLAPLVAFYLAPTPAPAREPERSALAALFDATLRLRTLLLWAGFFLVVLLLHLFINWLPLLLQGRGLPRTDAALAQSGFNVGGAAVAGSVGRLLDTRWRRAVLAATMIALPAALFAIANAPVDARALTAAAIFLGGAVLSAQIILYAAAGAAYPAWTRGTGIGAAVGAGRLGALAGPTLASLLLAAGRAPAEVLVDLVPIVVGAAICVGVLSGSGGRAASSAAGSCGAASARE